MPVINRFDGGVVIGVDEHYLDPTQSTVLLDADISTYGVKSAKASIEMGFAERSFYEFPVSNSEPQQFHITSSDRWRSYAEFNGRLLYSDGGPVCKATNGDMQGDDFKWYDIGANAVTGAIIARPLLLSDIATAKAELFVGSDSSKGTINIPVIQYRLVDDTDTVYIHTIDNNTGNATVKFTLPSTVRVYRELIDKYGNSSDKYIFVGSGTFIDGLTKLDDSYKFVAKDDIAEFSSHRISLVLGQAFSIPYKIRQSNLDIVLEITEMFELTNSDKWAKTALDISFHHLNPPADASGIASSFSYNDELFILCRLGNNYRVYKPNGALVVDTIFDIDDEFFKCTTVEWDLVTYFFSPSKGKVLTFDGNNLHLLSMVKFPYARAEDSVYTVRNGTVVAILNERHEANVRLIQLPNLAVEMTGNERVKLDKIRGLGGSSGCDLTDGDFQVFPIHRGIVTYSVLSGQVSRSAIPEANMPTNSTFKGFTFFNTLIRAISHRDDDLAVLYRWNVLQGHALTNTVFDVRTISGTFVYNVGQKTGAGQFGPIMLTQSSPVNIHKGHMLVDLSGINHTTEPRLYRTGGYLTEYKLVEDIDPGTMYKDKTDDVTIAKHPTGVYNYRDAPPEGLEGLTEHRGRLFGFVGDMLYWSEAGDMDSWDRVKSFLLLDRAITGIASAVFGLVIFMKGRIKLLVGNLPQEFQLMTVTNSKGCTDGRSIQSAREGVLFFSDDGLCFTDGRQVVEFSYKPLGSRDWRVVDSVSTSRSYYALCTNYMEGSIDPESVLMRLDLEQEPKFSFLDGDAVSGLGTLGGKLAHSNGLRLFKTLGYVDRIFNYKSGSITEGQPAMVKEWDRVRVSGNFVGKLFVRIDGRLAVKEQIIVGQENEVNLHLPKDSNKGRAMSIELVGTGIVTSIEYSITGRKTTK